MAQAMDLARLGYTVDTLENMLDTDGEFKVKEAFQTVPECKKQVANILFRTSCYCKYSGLTTDKYCLVGSMVPSKANEDTKMMIYPIKNKSHIPMLERIFDPQSC
ncbi:hypothetical protein [Floridanema aerugineum]|uniref:Uncharacterized protein n=1 Tax=Floridaenema aerugineum BLCC-F46 TaxID=3153654 RepID=A0ABV4X097_9CYAN